MAHKETDVIQIFLLGRFEIVRGTRRLLAADWKRRKAASLMQRLALEKRLPKEKAIDFLWPEASLTSGSNTLYRTLYALRQVLNNAFGPESDARVFSFVNGVLFLNDSVWVDAVVFEQLVSGPSPLIANRQEAHALYQGDLLPHEPYNDWLALPRESLRQLHRENCLALATYFSAEQAYSQAIPLLTPLLSHDPLDELIHRELMRLYVLSGQYATAVRQYHICAQSLQTELGIEPEEETKALLKAIESKQIAPVPSPAPEPPVDEEDEEERAPTIRHNLPAFPDTFVGRQAEIAKILHHLTRTDCRLLTLRGIGGIGKTRLAVQAISALIDSDHFADGLFFVNLAGIESSDYFITTIADTMNFSLTEATDPLEQLISYLRAKEMLLLLDNFEHIQSAAPQLSILLRQCPHLKLLVTSRHQLKLAGEFVLILDGLPPAQDRKKNSGASQLFQERARQIAPQLDLQAERLNIFAICQLVAGMPLAIEMCAAWIQTLNCREILNEIQQGLDLLETQRVDAPDRHLSIRAVFQASFNLLTPAEQQALLALAVFQGNFSHDAARQVAGANLPRLRSLVEKSMLGVREELAETRYQMHRLLRQFALETIEARQLAESKRQHALYYANLLETVAEKQCTPACGEIVSAVFIEADNLRSVWQWLGQQITNKQPPEQICHLLDQLLPAWSYAYFVKVQVLEGKQLLNSVWDQMGAAQWDTAVPRQQTTFARVAVILARFCMELSQFDDAIQLSQQAISILQTQTDSDSQRNTDYISYALRTWARALIRLGDDIAAEEKLKEGEHLAKSRNVKAGAVHTLGSLYMNRGEYDTALSYLSEALNLYEACHEQSSVLITTLAIGAVYGRRRQFEEAITRYKQVARLARRLGQKGTLMIALNNLAFCLHQIGRTSQIEEYYDEALAVAIELGRQRWQSVISQDFGMFLLHQGKTDKAAKLIQDGLNLAIALNSQPDVMAGLLPLAHWQAQHGRFEEAMVAVGYMMASEVTNDEMRTYAADLWDELSSELPPVFTQRAEATLETATLDDILAMVQK